MFTLFNSFYSHKVFSILKDNIDADAHDDDSPYETIGTEGECHIRITIRNIGSDIGYNAYSNTRLYLKSCDDNSES